MDVRKEGTVFKIRALVFYFQKRAGMTSSLPPLVAHLIVDVWRGSNYNSAGWKFFGNIF